jgi:hypothetical protein
VNPEKIIDNLFQELDVAIKAISKAKTADEKLAYSQIVKNISESLGILLNIANTIIDDDVDDYEH